MVLKKGSRGMYEGSMKPRSSDEIFSCFFIAMVFNPLNKEGQGMYSVYMYVL